MAPCLVKDMVDGSSSHTCGSIAPGDFLTHVDGVLVGTILNVCYTHCIADLAHLQKERIRQFHASNMI